MTITNKLDFVVSPVVLTELIDCIDPAAGDIDATMRLLVQEILDRSKIFMDRFRGIYFLEAEPIHEFTGLEFRDDDTGLVTEAIHYRLVIKGNSIGVFSTEEVPIDDMYDVRQIIAESQLPEFYEDKPPSKDA